MDYPPRNGSIIDVFAAAFGPAPRSLVSLILMGIGAMALITVPYWAGRVRRKLRGT